MIQFYSNFQASLEMYWKCAREAFRYIASFFTSSSRNVLSSSVLGRPLIMPHSLQVAFPEIHTICNRFAAHAPPADGGYRPTCYSGWQLVINGGEAKPIAFFWRLWEGSNIYAFSGHLLSSGPWLELKPITAFNGYHLISYQQHIRRFSASPGTSYGGMILNFVATLCHLDHWFMNTAYWTPLNRTKFNVYSWGAVVDR